jgi:hypothetical protein
MRRRYLLVVAVAVLALSAQPVAAQNASAVASDHTTFGTGSQGEPAPTTLTNMSVQGSGDSASVSLIKDGAARVAFGGGGTLRLIEGDGSTINTGVAIKTPGGAGDLNDDGSVEVAFVDSNGNIKFADEGGSVTDTGADTADGGLQIVGGVADFDGDRTLEIAFMDGSDVITITDASGTTESTGVSALKLGGAGDFDGDGIPEVAFRDSNGNLKVTDVAGDTTDTGVNGNDVGYMGDIDGDGSIDLAYLDSNQDGIEYVDSAGNVGVAIEGGNNRFDVGGVGDVDGDGDLDIAYQNGNANIAFVDAAGNTITTGVERDSLGGAGLIGVTPTSRASGSYIGAPHDAESVTSGWTNLTLQNADATVTWQEDADNDGTWTNVTSTTYSTSGNVTADLSATTSDRWRVRVEFDKTGSNAVAELHDEGILFASSGPTLSDPEPPDRVKIANATGEVSIKVSDADFPLAQSDSVTVSATDDDGNSLGSTTLTSNSTASFSYSSDAGENTIQWTATDEYGNTNTFTQTYTTPENLYIRPESDPDALVSGPNVSIQVRFYASDSVYTRMTGDGVVNLAGLPADARFAVVVSADGYYRRRVIIDSLFEQQSIYLLNESKPAVEKQFVLNDVSGNFPAQSTRLYVQRPINNSTTYKTVAADYFGATSAFSTFLQTDQRYRLIVENDQGDRRTLGSYTPVAAGVEPLRIEGVSLYRESQAGITANASTRFVNNSTQRQVVVRYRDPAAATSSYTVEVYERGNESNVTYSEQVTGPVQNYSAYVDVENSTNYVVNWSATRGGQQISGVRPVGGGDLGLRIPLPAQWLGTIGLTILVFVGSLAGERYATHLALAVVAFAGVLMYLAVVDIFLPLWWAGLLIAAGGHLAQRRPAA